ncbi:HD-GYP domain-containing protein [Sessilibacter sp. MAH4]
MPRHHSNGHFANEVQSKKIHISELKIGMWVSKLEKDWLETPFLMQGFLIESIDDIETVAQYSEYVWVDVREEHWVSLNANATLTQAPTKTIYINKIPVREENERIYGVYRDARRLTKSLLDEVRLTSVINTQQAKTMVRDCVESVLRNSDALMWMSKIRDRDSYTSEHCLNVCILAIAFGRQLGYDENALYDLGICGLLHDVGKMKIPLEILNKPGPLTDDEMKIMKRHSVYGRNLLMSAGSGAAQAVDVAWNHHERIDGQGYPRGLNDAQISRYSRVIAIVDAFDAMTADRVYQPPIPATQALKIIYQDKGTHFDAELAQEFIKTVGLYPPGSVVELMNGEVGLVFETNHKYRQLPKLIVLLDADKNPVKEKIVDLAQVEKGQLNRSYLIKDVLIDGSFGISAKEYQQRGLMFRSR